MNDRGATADQILQAAAALFSSFAWSKLVPFLAFCVMFGLLLYMLKKAQQNTENGFDFGDFFREVQRGKMSWKRLIGFLCFITHSWVVMSSKIEGTLTLNDMILYGGLWSSTATAMYALNIWRDVKGATPTPPSQ